MPSNQTIGLVVKMTSSEDNHLKAFATSTTHDFYELLNVLQTAGDTEIASAYRKTARQYHPDKLRNLSQSELDAASDKFHLVQTAHSILSDASLREIYDHARRAREAKKARLESIQGKRKEMVEDLERREREAARASKRQRGGFDVGDENGQDDVKQREWRRLAEEGARMRREFEAKKRREAEEAEAEDERWRNGAHEQDEELVEENGVGQVSDVDRSIQLRFPQIPETAHLDKEALVDLFSRFGSIDGLTLRDKKIKKDGEKHRILYTVAVIVFSSIVGAHAAMTDYPQLAKDEPWSLFEDIAWAGGREPDCVPKAQVRSHLGSKTSSNGIVEQDEFSNGEHAGPRGTANSAPKFGSFKKTGGTSSGPNLDEFTMMRLKNAERRRLEKKLLEEEMAAEGVGESLIDD